MLGPPPPCHAERREASRNKRCDEDFQALGEGFQGKRSMARSDESSSHAQLSERLHEVASKAVRVENPRPPASAGGKIMQLVETVVVTLPRHAGIL